MRDIRKMSYIIYNDIVTKSWVGGRKKSYFLSVLNGWQRGGGGYGVGHTFKNWHINTLFTPKMIWKWSIQTVWYDLLPHLGPPFLQYQLGVRSCLSSAYKLAHKKAWLMLFFMFLKFHLKSLDLSLSLEGGMAGKKEPI